MNMEQIRTFVSRYLEATECRVIEKHPAFVTVKLSPEADKALTNRPYYWSFVERTGAEPETMSITFIFDQEEFDKFKKDQEQLKQHGRSQSTIGKSRSQAGGAGDSGHGGATTISVGPGNPGAVGVTGDSGNAGNADAPGSTDNTGNTGNESILARYFGFTPAAVHQRVRQENVTFGSGRLNQIFASAQALGTYVHLYEQPGDEMPGPGRPAGYTSYLGVNYKIEYVCDMKRDELHSLGICLSTGEILSDFQSVLDRIPLSPKLPAHTHIKDMLSLPRAVAELEQCLESHIRKQDHRWAIQAEERMIDELDRIKLYYQEMIQNSKDEEEKLRIEHEYRSRQEEIAWQFKPRVLVSAVNCGIFHLLSPVRSNRKMANPL